MCSSIYGKSDSANVFDKSELNGIFSIEGLAGGCFLFIFLHSSAFMSFVSKTLCLLLIFQSRNVSKHKCVAQSNVSVHGKLVLAASCAAFN